MPRQFLSRPTLCTGPQGLNKNVGSIFQLSKIWDYSRSEKIQYLPEIRFIGFKSYVWSDSVETYIQVWTLFGSIRPPSSELSFAVLSQTIFVFHESTMLHFPNFKNVTIYLNLKFVRKAAQATRFLRFLIDDPEFLTEIST